MSDRKKAIETLKQLRLDYEEFHEEHNNEVTQAYDMAIASLETDEAYQLEYELTAKNDLVTLTFSKGTLKYSCKDYVVYKKDWLRSHYGAEIDIMFGDSQYKEPTTKNDLGVECIDRQATLDAIIKRLGIKNETYLLEAERAIYQQILAMPSVTPQEPRWIPVSEGLPKELRGVLVYCPINDNIFCAYLEKGVWKIFSPEALEEIKEIVTAWMPLPKAYREVEE